MPTEGDATEDFGRLLQNDRARFDQMVAKAVPIAIADGMAAVAYVRQHAADTACRLTELESWASRRAAA